MNNINSLSFQEDFVLWTEIDVEERTIHIKRAVSESLPLTIDQQSISQPIAIKQVANHLDAIAQKNQLTAGRVRFTIPGRFAVIKKIQVDEAIPAGHYPEIVSYQLEKTWKESPDNYQLYLPEYHRQKNGYTEILALAVRKEVLNFFEEAARQAHLELESLTPACFTVDEFFRTLHPSFDDEVLLLGWQRRGYDIIISDSQEFVDYQFRPYNANFSAIEQIDDEEILSRFDALIEDLRQPATFDKPLHEFSAIYIYGFHFQPEWLDFVRAQVQIPVYLFNLNESDIYHLAAESQEISSDRIYQIIEPVSNIF